MSGSKTQIADKLNALTSLRFVAALAVFIYHAKIFSSVFGPFQLGPVGIAFFFLLSGFIVTYVYHKKLEVFNRENVLKFYAARFAKIYPMHLLTFFVAAPAMFAAFGVVIGGPFNRTVAAGALASLSLTQAYFVNNANILFSFNNVSWTLSIEALFYAVFPFAALILGKYIYKASVARAVMWAFSLWAAMVVMSVTLPLAIQATPPLQLPEFLIGSLAAYIFINRPRLWIISTERRATLTEIFTIVCLALSMAISAVLPSTEAVAVSLAPALMLMIVVFAYQQGQISRFLAKRPFVFLGEISFSFYMVHMIILRGVGGIGNSKLAFLALALTLGVSVLTLNFVEEPVRKLIRRYTDDKIANSSRKLDPEPRLEPSSNF